MMKILTQEMPGAQGLPGKNGEGKDKIRTPQPMRAG